MDPPTPQAPLPDATRRAWLIERVVTLSLLAVVTVAARGRPLGVATAVAIGALVAMRLAAPLWARAMLSPTSRRTVTRAMAADAAESGVGAAVAIALGLWPAVGVPLAGAVAAAWAIAATAAQRREAASIEAAEVPLAEEVAAVARDAGFDPRRIVVDARAVATARVVRRGRRPLILLSRRVIEACTPAEQAVIVAHELGHVAAGDLRWTAAARAVLLVAIVAAAGAVAALGRRAGVAAPAAALALGIGETAAVFALAAMGRATERRAHRWALRAVGDGDVFAGAIRKCHALDAPPDAGEGPAHLLDDRPSLTEVLALAKPRRRRKNPLS